MRAWVNKIEVDTGKKVGVTSDAAAKIKELERENKELKQANEILNLQLHFLLMRSSTATSEIVQFIDLYRSLYGVEPICRVVRIAPSTYYRCKSLEAKPEQRCQRYHRDEALKPEIMRVWQENRRCYGARKVWKQMKREGFSIARCTVARLMKVLGIQGVRRGRHCITTIPDDSAAKPLDLVNCEFTVQRPNQL